MTIPVFRRVLYVTVALTALAGCASDMQPYIYVPSEFDRTRQDFGQPLKDRDGLIICYNKYKTTPKKIREMAALECARFDKRAVYEKQEVNTCPLLTPVSAHYRCVGPGDGQDKEKAATP